jgi:hypothetical protein
MLTDFGRSKLFRIGLLALPLLSAFIVATVLFHTANAQLTALSPAQQQALKSLVETGYTNHYPLKIGIVPNPPPSFNVPYSIVRGQVIVMAADQPRTSLDIILAPTQHQRYYGIFTIQIPRHLLDAKSSSGADIPFRVTLDGHGLAWKQIEETNTYRVIGIYFGPRDTLLQIFGTKISTG